MTSGLRKRAASVPKNPLVAVACPLGKLMSASRSAVETSALSMSTRSTTPATYGRLRRTALLMPAVTQEAVITDRSACSPVRLWKQMYTTAMIAAMIISSPSAVNTAKNTSKKGHRIFSIACKMNASILSPSVCESF